MPYVDQSAPHAGSAEVLYTGMYDEPAGTIARTIPRHQVGVGTLAAVNTTGTAAVNGIPLAQGMVISNIGILTGGTAAIAPTHWWLGLLDAGLNVLGVTADQTSTAIGSAASFVLALTLRVVIPQTGLYYVAVSTTAGRAPTLAG